MCLLIGAVLAGVSCKSTGSSATIEGEVTQQKVNDALGQIYDVLRPKLDLSGAQEYTVVKGDTLSAITRSHYGTLTGVGAAGLAMLLARL